MRTHAYLSLPDTRIHPYAHIYTHTYTYTHTHAHIHRRLHIYIQIRIYIPAYAHVTVVAGGVARYLRRILNCGNLTRIYDLQSCVLGRYILFHKKSLSSDDSIMIYRTLRLSERILSRLPLRSASRWR